jgi:hypothetical protein
MTTREGPPQWRVICADVDLCRAKGPVGMTAELAVKIWDAARAVIGGVARGESEHAHRAVRAHAEEAADVNRDELRGYTSRGFMR